MDSKFKQAMAPSLSLLTLAALTPAGHDVEIEDHNVSQPNERDRPDLVGITVNVDSAERAYRIAACYRGRGVPVIVGGLHPSACPEEAGRYSDSVCIGEAEHLWAGIVQDASTGMLKPQYYHAQPTEVSAIPLPRWDLLDKNKYLYTNIITASRGCPHSCEFCYNSCDYVHHLWRGRPIATVLAEVRALKTRHVMFIDDNFIGEASYARQLVEALRPMKLIWHAAVSTDIDNHPELLDAMAESGCRSLFIGFESINGESLANVAKHQNRISRFDRLIAGIHDRGMMVNASMVFGFDHDYPDVFDRTLEWLIHNRIESVTAHILTPYPGTRLYRRLDCEGRIIDRNLSNYNTSNVVFRPRNMSEDQLRDGYLRLYREFYSLGSIMRRLPRQASLRLPFLLFNIGYRKYGKLTSSVLGRMKLLNVTGRVARRLAYGI